MTDLGGAILISIKDHKDKRSTYISIRILCRHRLTRKVRIFMPNDQLAETRRMHAKQTHEAVKRVEHNLIAVCQIVIIVGNAEIQNFLTIEGLSEDNVTYWM